jgi:hypothetical protein
MRNLRHNEIVLVVCGLIFTFYFVMLYIYKDDMSIGDIFYKANPNPIVVSTSTPISENETEVSTTTSGTSTSTPTIKPKPVEVLHAVGIAAGSKLVGLSDTVLDEELSGMVALGIKWVRFDIEWGFVQYSSPDNYDWSRYDKIVDGLNKYGLKALPILTYSPEWARVPGCRGGSHCPPAKPNTFAVFAEAAVNRYKGKGIHYWEIWNEPNSYDFWATKADCKAYTELLKVTYPVMKNADSRAFVITGGMAPISTTDVNVSPHDFLDCIYNNGGKNYFDAVGHHPYTFPVSPLDNNTNAWYRMSNTAQSLRDIMIRNGDSKKKMWLTEYGAPTGGPDSNWFVTEENQARIVTDVMAVYKTLDWVGPIFWYTYIDSGFEPTSNENFFGLVRFDKSRKPAFDALRNIISNGI